MSRSARSSPAPSSGQKAKSSASAPSLRSRVSEVVSVGSPKVDGSAGGNVRVVVRVRAFLPREIERGARCLVQMDSQSQRTKLLAPGVDDPANAKVKSRKVIDDKAFTFDNSFWSHEPADQHYAKQDDVYNALGEEFLDHNFEGYHTCIFAYGQTGSGKSYTMMGGPDEPGLIPRTCEDLFQRIDNNQTLNVDYTVRVSYFEVYNEHVRDLLSPRSSNGQQPNYLKIREDPVEGPYVKDLRDPQVKNYKELLAYMRMGDAARTIAATKMNDTSSRSHAVFTIQLKQLHHDLATDHTTERVARIRLVDLAGSERSKATGSTGQRFKEGSQINQSLSTLGRVIHKLSENRSGHSKRGTKEVVPYRDSILTWLLKDSLGGNSKTAMIACIAPSDYDETLSTLRFADSAKRIRTCAKVNEDTTSTAQRDAQVAALQDTIRDLQQQVSLANEAAHEANTASRAKQAAKDDRNERMDAYAAQVERLQRLVEEERLVSEQKIRQMEEQNASLRRHLELTIDQLKNPLPATFNNQAPRSATTTDDMPLSRKVSARDFEQENQKPDERDDKVHVPVTLRDPTPEPPLAWVPPDAQRDRLDGEELMMHLHELLGDLGVYKDKLADDRRRFCKDSSRGSRPRPPKVSRRAPLGEVQLN